MNITLTVVVAAIVLLITALVVITIIGGDSYFNIENPCQDLKKGLGAITATRWGNDCFLKFCRDMPIEINIGGHTFLEFCENVYQRRFTVMLE